LPRLSRGRAINFEMDAADKIKRSRSAPRLWGKQEAQRRRTDIPTVWPEIASNLETIEPLATGHYIQEEMPSSCLDRFFNFSQR